MLVPLSFPPGYDGRLWRFTDTGQRLEPHRHMPLEMNFALGGQATYLLDDRTYTLGRNALVWLFPGQNHQLLHLSRDFAMWIVVASPQLTTRLADNSQYAVLHESLPDGHFCRRISESEAEWLHMLCARLRDQEDEATLYNVGLAYLTAAFWNAYQAADPVRATAQIHPSVERAITRIRASSDVSGSENLAVLAAEAGLSLTRLGVLFRRQTGMTLGDFRNRVRLERFERIYAAGQHTLLGAALEAGFGSYAQFFRVFRRHHHCRPSAKRGIALL